MLAMFSEMLRFVVAFIILHSNENRERTVLQQILGSFYMNTDDCWQGLMQWLDWGMGEV